MTGPSHPSESYYWWLGEDTPTRGIEWTSLVECCRGQWSRLMSCWGNPEWADSVASETCGIMKAVHRDKEKSTRYGVQSTALGKAWEL